MFSHPIRRQLALLFPHTLWPSVREPWVLIYKVAWEYFTDGAYRVRDTSRMQGKSDA